VGGRWQLVALVVGELRVFFACGGDARAPVYSEEQSRDICEDPRLCLGGGQPANKTRTGGTKQQAPAVGSRRPTHGTISSTSLPQQDLSQRQAAQRSRQKPNRMCHETKHMKPRREKMRGHGQFGMPVTHVHNLFVL
jgi:hypothetical protein